VKRRYPPPDDPDEIRLIAKCKELGVEVWRLGDFGRSPESHVMTEDIAVLLSKEADQVGDKFIASIIVEVLQHSAFRETALQAAVRVLRKAGGEFHGQIAANSIDRLVTSKDTTLVAQLILDPKLGASRSLLVPTYARIARKSGIAVLRKLVSDPETRSDALKHLSILGDTSIEPELRELAKHPDSYHRKIARDAIARVEKNKLKARSASTH
jgi:HEAT repeat protein